MMRDELAGPPTQHQKFNAFLRYPDVLIAFIMSRCLEM